MTAKWPIYSLITIAKQGAQNLPGFESQEAKILGERRRRAPKVQAARQLATEVNWRAPRQLATRHLDPFA